MKKAIIAILVIVCSFQMEAQENQNSSNWTLGGSIALSRDKTTTNLESNFYYGIQGTSIYIYDRISLFGSFNPYIAKRLSNNSIIGLGIILERSILKFTSDNYNSIREQKNTTTTIGLNSFYRQHVFTRQKMEIFIQGKMEISSSKVKSEEYSETEELSSSLEYRAALDPGITYSLSDKWNIVIIIHGLKYQYFKFNASNSDSSTFRNLFSINTSLKNTQFGIEFRF